MERLVGKGRRVRIHDENVSLARLLGGNKAYIEERLPHISELLSADAAEVVDGAEVIIIGAALPEYAELLAAKAAGKKVVDLVRLWSQPPGFDGYQGICW